MSTYIVIATELNLRSTPGVGTNLMAVLPQGHEVVKVSEAPNSWWKVRTRKGGLEFEGFVKSTYLKAKAQAPPLHTESSLSPVHLKPSNAVLRTGINRAFPLHSPNPPMRTTPGSAQELLRIVDWLDVDNPAHERWRASNSQTFCNIYAYDYCFAAGVYLPRVWWTSKAIQDLTAGRNVSVQYGVTVRELRANDLYDWLEDYGPSFGWSRVKTLDEVQDAANQGGVSVVVGQRKDLARSGHITAVVAEANGRSALRSAGKVVRPLQSQAGASNFQYGTGSRQWWLGTEFRAHGFWTHP